MVDYLSVIPDALIRVHGCAKRPTPWQRPAVHDITRAPLGAMHIVYMREELHGCSGLPEGSDLCVCCPAAEAGRAAW